MKIEDLVTLELSQISPGTTETLPQIVFDTLDHSACIDVYASGMGAADELAAFMIVVLREAAKSFIDKEKEAKKKHSNPVINMMDDIIHNRIKKNEE